MNTHVIGYMQARQALKSTNKRMADERAEQLDAKRTLGNLLTESMQRHNMECVAMPSGYVRVTQPRRLPPLKTDEEVQSLLRNLAPHIVDVPVESLADAIVKIVKERAQQREAKVLPARVSLCNKTPPPKTLQTVEVTRTPTETRNLLEQYVQACKECQDTQTIMKPLRKAQKDAEKAVLASMAPPPLPPPKVVAANPATSTAHPPSSSDPSSSSSSDPSSSGASSSLSDPASSSSSDPAAAVTESTFRAAAEPIHVRMEDAKGKEKIVQLVRCERRRSSTSSPSSYGIRSILHHLREVVPEVAALRHDVHAFETSLQTKVLAKLKDPSSADAPASSSSYYLKVLPTTKRRQ